MANEEVLGPRKTMFVLVIVVGCFAVLWPRILSPLVLGPSRDHLKSNQLDRDAGCCDVIFETELAVLELINEVCASAVHVDGKLSAYAGAECRKAVNETCGVDIVAFIKHSDNVGKSSRMLVETMKGSNSSCLKEHFGVPLWSHGPHTAINSWMQQDTLKQERSPIRGAGPHPALRERGRAIPAGAPPPSNGPIAMPPHVRVRSSPLSVYFELDIKPPPIPGMRPPLGSPGGPVTAPKSSMGFVMPIYTICIIVFFVYTLSKILFKRSGPSPYETVSPDPQFRRRVFRDDSRTSPDKLGPKERDTIVTAISGLVAEVQQQMEANYAQAQQRQDVQDNHTRPYTNGTILHNSGPVHIVASEYREQSKERESVNLASPKEREPSPVPEEPENLLDLDDSAPNPSEVISETVEAAAELAEATLEQVESEEPAVESQEPTIEMEDPKLRSDLKPEETSDEPNLPDDVADKIAEELKDIMTSENSEESILDQQPLETEKIEEIAHLEHNIKESTLESNKTKAREEETAEIKMEDKEADLIEIEESSSPEFEKLESQTDELFKLTDDAKVPKNGDIKSTTDDFLKEELREVLKSSDDGIQEKQSTPDLLEEAIRDEDEEKNDDEEEKSTVKVLGMETTAHSADGGAWSPPQPAVAAPPAPQRVHEAEEVTSIYLDTEIPQQSRVLVADFADRADRPAPTRDSPMVVSAKMTLSLIQDAPRDTPERDPESTVDDFTTASAVTQDAAEKGVELSDEEVEEEIEIEEIEEEVEEEEEEEVEEVEAEPKKDEKKEQKTE